MDNVVASKTKPSEAGRFFMCKESLFFVRIGLYPLAEDIDHFERYSNVYGDSAESMGAAAYDLDKLRDAGMIQTFSLPGIPNTRLFNYHYTANV
jgi:hypothetical protein